MASMIRYSLIVPVYGNADSIRDLLSVCADLSTRLEGELEVVFVVDASPDDSHERLADALPGCGFPSMLLLLSRNFGSFAAIREGLRAARGDLFAVMAADLQEPPGLILGSFQALDAGEADVVVGVREGRSDPLPGRLGSSAFWWLYRRLVQPDVPEGGVDVFACNRGFRDRLVALPEANSTLVGLIFWMGYRRKILRYRRLPRRVGKSAWTFSRKRKYLADSVFAFSDLPVRLLMLLGAIGLTVSTVLGAVVLVARLSGAIPVPGYAAIVLTILFFAGLNSLGLGVIGAYVWRTFENTKGRPLALVMTAEQFPGREAALASEEHQ